MKSPRIRFFVFVVIAISITSAKGFTQEKVPQNGLLRGFHEVVVSVYDIGAAIKFYQEVGGWEIAAFGDAPPELAKFWGIKDGIRIEEAVLRNKGDKSGWMRLVKFHLTDSVLIKQQRQIRSSAHPWEAGGIFDLNIRVKDVKAKFIQLQRLGWQAYADPQRFTVGKFDLEEVLLRGHDGVVLAFTQRYAPALDAFKNMREFSYIFHSTQIVKDVNASYDFYVNKLGFKIYMKNESDSKTLSSTGENVLGLPYNHATAAKRKAYILHPQGTNDGSVEIMQIEGITGKDYAGFAAAPNLGLLLLRFPCTDLDTYKKRIVEKGIVLHRDIATLEVAPYGKIRTFVVRSPDGVWLEFFEAKGVE